MTVEEVLSILENGVAPVKLSDDYCKAGGHYDNSGIIINCANEVTGIVFSLDLSESAVLQAGLLGYNLIVTHHPAIFHGIKCIDVKNSPGSRAIAYCIEKGISVISMHLNFDAATEGIDYHLMKGLGGENFALMDDLGGGCGYGRAYDVAPVALPEFLERVAENFSTSPVCHGIDERIVRRVASFCGAGCDLKSADFAKRQGADAVVASDLGHHVILELVESGIAVIQITHYASETYGFNKIYHKIVNQIPVPSTFFTDGRFL